MGDLLTQSSILGAFEKLSNAEVVSGITCRAGAALKKTDRGRLLPGFKADLAVFPTGHCNVILYHQGQLRPSAVWKGGTCVVDKNA